MKSLLYKGFGRDGKGEVKFNISVIDRELISKFLVEAYASDQRIEEINYKDRADKDKINIRVTSEIWPTSFEVCEIEWNDLPQEDWEDLGKGNNSSSLIKKFSVYSDFFDDMPSAIIGIKALVEGLRKQWRESINLHNKLAVELKELSIENFLEEAPLEITLSQTVVKK